MQTFDNLQIQQNLGGPSIEEKQASPQAYKVVHKPFGFNINQFKNEYKEEIYEGMNSVLQKSSISQRRSKSIARPGITPLCKQMDVFN